MPNKALLESAELGNVKALKEVLDSGVPVDELTNESAATALWITAQKGHFEATKYLVERGADVNKPNKVGISPLFIASSRGFDKIITLLLQYSAVLEVDNPSKRTPMFVAVASGRLNAVKALLKAPEAKLNERGVEGQTLLLTAAASNKVEILKWLLQQGASLEEKNDAGETALDIATKYKRQDVINFLQNYSVKLRLAIAWKNLAPYQRVKDFTILSYHFLYRNVFSKIPFKPTNFFSYKTSTISLPSPLAVSSKENDPKMNGFKSTITSTSQEDKLKIAHDPNVIHSVSLAAGEVKEQAKILSQHELALDELEDKILKRIQGIEQKINQLKQELSKPDPTEKTLKEQRKRIITLENNFSRQASISSTLNEELANLKLEVEAFQKHIHQETYLKDQLKLHQQKIDSLEEVFSEQTEQTSKFTTHLEKLQLQITELEKQLLGHNHLKEELRLQKNKSKQDFHRTIQLENSLKELKESINSIQLMFSKISQSYSSFSGRIEGLESQAKLIELQSQQMAQLKKELELQKNQFQLGLQRINQLELLLREQALKIPSQDPRNVQEAQQTTVMQAQLRRLEQQLEFIQKNTSDNRDLKKEIGPFMQRIIQLENNFPRVTPQPQMQPFLPTLDPQMLQLQLQQQQMNLLYNPYINFLQGVPPIDSSLLNGMPNVQPSTPFPGHNNTQLDYLPQSMSQPGTIIPSSVNVTLLEPMFKVLHSFTSSYHVLIVGGAVRDLLLGKVPADVDIITNMPPEVILAHFKDYAIHASPHFSGYYQMIQFGMKIDMISCESDVFLSMEALVRNAQTRAFTVNALYCDIQGRIYDPLQIGLSDLLQNPCLRFINDSHSWFERDPILLLRAVRLASQYELKISEEMRQSIQHHSALLKTLETSRLHVEMKRLFLRGMSTKNFGYLIEWGLLAILYPKTVEFLESERSGHYVKWLQEKLQQTDNLILNQKPASVNYIYALLLTGSILSIPEIKKYNINQVIEQEITNALFNLDAESIHKIQKIIYRCMQDLLPDINSKRSIEKSTAPQLPVLKQIASSSNFSEAQQPIVIQFQTTLCSKKKNSIKRANSDPNLHGMTLKL